MFETHVACIYLNVSKWFGSISQYQTTKRHYLPPWLLPAQCSMRWHQEMLERTSLVWFHQYEYGTLMTWAPGPDTSWIKASCECQGSSDVIHISRSFPWNQKLLCTTLQKFAKIKHIAFCHLGLQNRENLLKSALLFSNPSSIFLSQMYLNPRITSANLLYLHIQQTSVLFFFSFLLSHSLSFSLFPQLSCFAF